MFAHGVPIAAIRSFGDAPSTLAGTSLFTLGFGGGAPDGLDAGDRGAWPGRRVSDCSRSSSPISRCFIRRLTGVRSA